MDDQNTLVLIKPDGVERLLVGTILARFERRRLAIVKMRSLWASATLIDAHYAHLLESPHYPRILGWMTRGPLVAVHLAGTNAVETARQTVGATDPLKAAPGTIRGDFANWIGANLVHASASAEEAANELRIWFPDDATKENPS